MKISAEVREFAAHRSAPSLLGEGDRSAQPHGGGADADAAEAGMAEMSKRFHEEGGELYIGANGRTHD